MMKVEIRTPAPPLEVDELLETSRRQAGLQDFGLPDVREPLRVLVDSLNREAQLTAAGIQGQRVNTVRLLVNRLRIARDLKVHPEIRDQVIAGPIVIVGLPRTGTTKLQRMMAADSALQSLPFWKILNPAPFGSSDTSGPDPRIAAAAAHIAALRERHPDFYAAHPMDATEPDEEEMLMEISFLGYLYPHVARVPAYQAWVDAQPFERWYDYLRTLLQYYQFQDRAAGRHWLLKAPAHLGYLPLLFQYFPKATVVHCHRDPLASIASLCGLVAAARRFHSDRNDPTEVGRFVLNLWSRQMRRYVGDRESLSRERHFVDVPYHDVVANARDVIARIYRSAGLELSARALAAMEEWESANAQHKHGEHRYRLEDYGLSEAEVEEAFRPYCDRFLRKRS